MIEKFDYCYHTHTFRCGHAYGTDEEYVLEAIKQKIKILGFSDHVILPGINEPGMRGAFSELDEYFRSINYLKEKYHDQIKIIPAFEAEYDEHFVPYYESLFELGKIEYLVLGQHSYYNSDLKRMTFYGSDARRDPEGSLKAYTKRLIEAMGSGLFSVVAHPDLMMQSYLEFDELCKEQALLIIDASIKYDIPLEINFGGLRTGKGYGKKRDRYRYPVREFWELVSKSNAKVIVGVDAHSPSNLDYVEELDITNEMIGDLTFNFVSRIKMRKEIKEA